VAKPELGTKRLCASCGAKFYDLSKNPIVCPKCETVFEPVVAVTRGRPDQAARAAAVKVPEVAVPEVADTEFVSLEDADAEAAGGKKPVAAAVEGEDDIEVDETLDDDDTFIEETEEGEDDVTDIIGDVANEEET
jgi:uncharacterized protein (TIGR02300 family)